MMRKEKEAAKEKREKEATEEERERERPLKRTQKSHSISTPPIQFDSFCFRFNTTSSFPSTRGHINGLKKKEMPHHTAPHI
jgi:hypothetical protein